MLLFDTELRASEIHGIGVFLLEPVKEGDVIWRFDSRIDRVYSENELGELPPRLRQFLRVYSRSEEHTSELQSLMRISYAVFCLKKKNKDKDISVKNIHEQDSVITSKQQINKHNIIRTANIRH